MNRVEVIISHWWKLTHGSLKRKIFGAATIIALYTLVTQLASVAKELTVVAWFGVDDAIYSFLLVYAILKGF